MVPVQGASDPTLLPPASASPQYGPMAAAHPPRAKRQRQEASHLTDQQGAFSSLHSQRHGQLKSDGKGKHLGWRQYS